MNFAFPTLTFILVFLIPGFIFYKALFRKNNDLIEIKPFSSEAVYIIVLGLLSNAIVFGVISLIFCNLNSQQALKTLFSLLVTPSEKYSNQAVNALALETPLILIYLLILYAFSLFLGIIIKYAGLNLRWKFIYGRYLNSYSWYQLLNKNKDIDVIYIDATIKFNSEITYLYRGMLVEYYLDKHNNGLTDLILKYTYKKDVTHPDSAFEEIEGEYFTLKYAETSTLNISYYQILPE